MKDIVYKDKLAYNIKTTNKEEHEVSIATHKLKHLILQTLKKEYPDIPFPTFPSPDMEWVKDMRYQMSLKITWTNDLSK